MKKAYQYLFLALLCFLLLWLIKCKSPEDENEMSIMNTATIDGVKSYSYVGGYFEGSECKFIPVPEKHNDNIARDKE